MEDHFDLEYYSCEDMLYQKSSTYNYDPLYYHEQVKILHVKAKTDKCFLVDLEHYGEYWIPKSIIVGKVKPGNDVHIHESILHEIME